MAIETPETRFERWRTRGDGAALADVFDALAPGLLRLAIHLVGDPAAAEDLVQQSFVTAMERAASWDGRRPLEPWLQGILANHARDLKKSAQRAHDASFDLETVLAREQEAPLETASRRELSGELARAVDALEEPYRAAVLLRLRHGMEAADIAHVLGRSTGAVRVQLHRAREMLRKSLPASIASALLILAEPARGLGSARNQVLEHAARLAPAASTGGALIGGAIVMKKLVVAVALVLVGIAAFLATRSDESVEPVRAPLASTPTDSGAATSAELRVEPIEPAVQRAREVEIAAAPPPDTREMLRGIVRDANTDAPIAGARIALYAPLHLSLREVRTRWWDRFQVMSDGTLNSLTWPHLDDEATPAQRAGVDPVLVRAPPGAGVPPIAETTSGTDGRFELAAESVDGLITCAAQGYAVRETATGQRDVALDPKARTIYLARSITLRGRIVDAAGAPILSSVGLSMHGSAPSMFRSGTEPARESHPRRFTVYTDAEGRFEAEIDAHYVFVKSLDPRWTVDEPRRGDPTKPSWPQKPWFDLVQDSGEAFVVLRPEISLLLRDAVTREPIEDAHVSVRETATSFPLMRGWFHLEDGRLGIGGERNYYSLTREESKAKRGAATCAAWAPGYARASTNVPDLVELRVVELDLVRDTAGFVRGRVTHAGRAANGARLLAFEAHPASSRRGEDGAPISGAVADADGRFELEVPAGRYLLTIEHEDSTVRRALDVPCADELAIELEATAAVQVRVTDANGAPIASRDVRSVDAHGVQTNGTTDSHGVARIENLGPGSHRIQLSHGPSGTSFWAHQQREIELVAGQVEEVAFTAPSVGPRYARLVVEDGPIPGWKAQRSPWRGGGTDVEVDGRIPLDLVEDRSFVVISPTGTTTWVVMPEDAPDGSEVRVRNGGAGYRGQVLDMKTSEPLRRVRVWFRVDGDADAKSPSKLATVDAEGRFEVRGLDAVKYSIHVVATNGTMSDLPGNLDFEPHELPADPPRELVLRRPRLVGGDYEGIPGIGMNGRIVGTADDLVGGMVFVSTKFPGDGCSLALHNEARVREDGTFQMRMQPTEEATISVWSGTNPPKLLVHEKWRPSGADPEVREFTLKP